ncbi:toll/interleukin-1 receptor domain-containing protein [Streptomyces sp. AcE210]|uniref:toll/interleukin-1 receptor domain-containing protein n=1 Tax=Streptomyces sp. AcE210 TaxID=2292703 RepID=UPI000E301E98|nr:toll/interleukin-1 receptor domain-containing protein [Streptomyces sp. AcE210]RFC70579.1 TIR domain-containing protein [Streptomyces sp. AcE210]
MTGSRRSATDPPPISNLPVQATPFVGRDEEIAAVHDLFEDHRAVLLHDPADRQHGYGKSEAAITYCHRYRMRYRVAWWFNCSHESDPRRLRQLIERGTDELHTRYREVLRVAEIPERPDDKWLLLYDNVADPDRVQDLFPAGDARILVTSRPPGAAWVEAARLPVGDLDPAEVASLFRQLAEIRQPVAEDLARAFAGHPQQIIAVAEQIRRGTPPATCVALADAVRLAPAPARPAPPQPSGHVRMSAQDRETLIDTLLSSPVCRDLPSYRAWIEAIDRRAAVSSGLPSETETIRTRVVGLVSIALSRDAPDVLLALAKTFEDRAGRHEAQLVRALIGPAAANWNANKEPIRAVLPPRPADAPFFFTSYANREDDQDHVAEFHEQLEQELRIKRGRNVTSTGFLDRRSLQLGLTWREPMVEAIRSTRLLVALITADYFESEWCRREWAVMTERARRAGRSPGDEPVAILPLFWVKPRGPLPKDLAAIQYSSPALFGGSKAPDNLIDLLREDRKKAAAFIRRLADTMIDAADRDLPALDADAVRDIPLAFGEWDTGDTSLSGSEAGSGPGTGGAQPHPEPQPRAQPTPESEPDPAPPEQAERTPALSPVPDPRVSPDRSEPPVRPTEPPAVTAPTLPAASDKTRLIEALTTGPLREPTRYTPWVEAVLRDVDQAHRPAVTQFVDPLRRRVHLLVNFAYDQTTPDLFRAMARALTLVDPGGATAPDETVTAVHKLVDRIVAAWPHHT